MTRNVVLKRSASCFTLRARAFCKAVKSAFCATKDFFIKVSEIKKELSLVIKEVSEELAEKTAREGLFGEDRHASDFDDDYLI